MYLWFWAVTRFVGNDCWTKVTPSLLIRAITNFQRWRVTLKRTCIRQNDLHDENTLCSIYHSMGNHMKFADLWERMLTLFQYLEFQNILVNILASTVTFNKNLPENSMFKILYFKINRMICWHLTKKANFSKDLDFLYILRNIWAIALNLNCKDVSENTMFKIHYFNGRYITENKANFAPKLRFPTYLVYLYTMSKIWQMQKYANFARIFAFVAYLENYISATV